MFKTNVLSKVCCFYQKHISTEAGIQLFRERLSEKSVHATIPKDNIGYDQYTVPNDCSCRTYFGCFPLAIASITSQTSCIILLNFFEEQCTQNHPQYLSGLPRALFATTFLEIAVGTFKECAHAVFSNFRLNKNGTVYQFQDTRVTTQGY